MLGNRELKIRIAKLEYEVAKMKAEKTLQEIGINTMVPPANIKGSGEPVFPVRWSYLENGKMKRLCMERTGAVYEEL